MQHCMNEMTLGSRGGLLADIEVCARHGYTHMEIRRAGLLEYLRQGGTLEELSATFERCGIKPACLNSIESISFNGKRGMRVLTEMSEYLFYCCRAIGCDCVEVIGSFKVEGTQEEIHAETVRALLQLSDALVILRVVLLQLLDVGEGIWMQITAVVAKIGTSPAAKINFRAVSCALKPSLDLLRRFHPSAPLSISSPQRRSARPQQPDPLLRFRFASACPR